MALGRSRSSSSKDRDLIPDDFPDGSSDERSDRSPGSSKRSGLAGMRLRGGQGARSGQRPEGRPGQARQGRPSEGKVGGRGNSSRKAVQDDIEDDDEPDREIESYLAALTDEPAGASDATQLFTRSQVYQLRLPAEANEQIKRIAEARNSSPGALAQEWVLDRLNQETGLVVGNFPAFDADPEPESEAEKTIPQEPIQASRAAAPDFGPDMQETMVVNRPLAAPEGDPLGPLPGYTPVPPAGMPGPGMPPPGRPAPPSPF